MLKSEKRKEQRLEMALPASLMVETSDTKTAPVEYITHNVSSCGAFFITGHPLETGTPLNIRMLILFDKDKIPKNGKTLVQLSARVVRTEKQGMAVEFARKFKLSPME
jgi:hypothetical protein